PPGLSPPITSTCGQRLRASGTVWAWSRAVKRTGCPSPSRRSTIGSKSGTCGEFARSIQTRIATAWRSSRSGSSRRRLRLQYGRVVLLRETDPRPLLRRQMPDLPAVGDHVPLLPGNYLGPDAEALEQDARVDVREQERPGTGAGEAEAAPREDLGGVVPDAEGLRRDQILDDS